MPTSRLPMAASSPTTTPSTISTTGRVTLAGSRWDYSAADTNSIRSITGGNVDVFGPVVNNINTKIAVVGGAKGIFRDTFTNHGTIFVSPGSELVMLQNLGFSASASLDVALSKALTSDPSDSFGRAVTLGPANLAGTLNVTLTPGYAPTLGDAFQLISAGGGINGTVTTENLQLLTPGLNWNSLYDSNSLTLKIVPADLAGDFDSDGDVDGRDFLTWQRGASPNPNSAADLAAWRINFGIASQLTANSVAVPEPTATWPALVSLLALGRWRNHLHGFPRAT